MAMEEHLTPEQVRDRMVELAHEDGRYSPSAFFLVNDAVQAAAKWLKSGEMRPRDVDSSRGEDGVNFHVSGFELLEAMRRVVRERWGSMARLVLESWGLRRTEDIGEIVFMMVDDEKLGWRKRDSDSKADFDHVYDFATTFDVWED